MSNQGLLVHCIFTHFSQNGSWTRNHLSKMFTITGSKSENFVRFEKRLKLAEMFSGGFLLAVFHSFII